MEELLSTDNSVDPYERGTQEMRKLSAGMEKLSLIYIPVMIIGFFQNISTGFGASGILDDRYTGHEIKILIQRLLKK